MTTRKKLEAVARRASDKAFHFWCEYDTELEWLYVRRGNSRKVISLKERYGNSVDDLSKLLEAQGVEIYEEDTDSPRRKYRVCTSRAIARLRYLEKKIAEWEEKSCAAEFALEDLSDE